MKRSLLMNSLAILATSGIGFNNRRPTIIEGGYPCYGEELSDKNKYNLTEEQKELIKDMPYKQKKKYLKSLKGS